MTPPAAGIALESVRKRYETPAGPVLAVDGITLELEPGRSLAVTGPSGCGKSTLLALIGGLEPPTEGRVSLGGVELSTLPPRARAAIRRAGVGLVFQSANLLPFLTVAENVGLQLAMNDPGADYSRCLEALVGLGLANHADKLPDQLSGGERRRVAVARALIHRPSVILADEPTGSLDEANSTAVVDLLLATRAQLGATLVVVTHDPLVAARLDRTITLRDGRLREPGVA